MKRIAYFVIAMHLTLILWSALWMPRKKVEKKPLQVRTVVQVPAPKPPPPQVVVKPQVQPVAEIKPKPKPAPKPKPTPAPPKPKPTPAPPKPKPKPAPQPKRAPPPKKEPPAVPANLVQQLQESIAKIDQTDHKESAKPTLPTPKLLKEPPKLKIDEENLGQECVFVATLVQCLRSTLDLPEVGEVKVELTLRRDGSFVKVKVLQSESEKNKRFLEQELKTITFPSFTGELNNEKEHAFVITFCNS